MGKKKGPSFFGKGSYFGEGGYADRQRPRRERPINKEVYGNRDYGKDSHARTGRTFDGYPSLSKVREDGAIDIIYGPEPIDLNDPLHGHAVIKNGKLIYKRRPGETVPVVNLKG